MRLMRCLPELRCAAAGEAVGEPHRNVLGRRVEDQMSRTRAADDFEMIRARMEELRREKLSEQPSSTIDASTPGHRGRCACGMSLFPDECDGSCKAL